MQHAQYQISSSLNLLSSTLDHSLMCYCHMLINHCSIISKIKHKRTLTVEMLYSLLQLLFISRSSSDHLFIRWWHVESRLLWVSWFRLSAQQTWFCYERIKTEQGWSSNQFASGLTQIWLRYDSDMTQHSFSFSTLFSFINILFIYITFFSCHKHISFRPSAVSEHYINRSFCINLLLYS